ncbi:MAG: HD domain-containing protein [Oscillospiraceae bacterium]|nr:HD domain-containing protein [Oscillospiraceae bacterium]
MVLRKKSSRTESLVLLLCTIAAGVGLNFLGRLLNTMLGLPLYLDNIGTILTALTGGVVPCITVGFFSNILNGLNDTTSMYYSVISILIASAAVECVRKRMLNRFPHILLSVLIFALIGGVGGGALTWLIYGRDFGEGYAVDLAARIRESLSMGYFSSNMLATFLVDLVDKAAVTAASVLLYLAVPKNWLLEFRRQSWYLRRSPKTEGRTTRKRLSLSVKASLAVSLSLTVAISGAVAVSIIQYHNSAIREYEDKGGVVTAILAGMLDEEHVEDLLAKGREAVSYREMVEELDNVLESSPEVKYIYAYRVRADGCLVVYDMDVPDVEADNPGDLIEFDETVAKYVDRFLAGEEIPPDITEDEYGWLLSVYRPVLDAEGELLCYAIVDLSMDNMRAEEIAFLAKLISLFIGFLFLIIVHSIWLMRLFIIQPVNTIADAANRFSYDTPEARVKSRSMVEELSITSGDEIENLYNAYRKTTADMMAYIDEVQHKSDQITKLQNGLILVLADMVESRDQNTGDHVKKTSAYVAIILEQMKKEGIYADKLTDSYIYDVVHSAPLHDVGKITISDTILNKPGKLTDEEFAVMKTHAASGEVIINRVINTMHEESDYLNEAKKLAAYHHEKWNGLGYPRGLKGEEIPLSARVMAVADVFDALISRRSYKGPYSVEKSLQIIRDGTGTHFDPQVVKAFLDAEPEIRRVAELNMENDDLDQYNL